MQPFDFAVRDRRLTNTVPILMTILGLVLLAGMLAATLVGHVK